MLLYVSVKTNRQHEGKPPESTLLYIFTELRTTSSCVLPRMTTGFMIKVAIKPLHGPRIDWGNKFSGMGMFTYICMGL